MLKRPQVDFDSLPEGKEWTDALLDEERTGIDSARANDVYEDFCSQNDSFKQLVTDWQIKIIDGEQQLNDHTDEAYDQQIINRLVELDQVVGPIFQGAATLAPRLAALSCKIFKCFISTPVRGSFLPCSPIER